jgi:hypothetical protein
MKTPPNGAKRAGPSGDGVPVNVDALLKSYHRIRREQIRINFRRDRIYVTASASGQIALQRCSQRLVNP